MKKLILFSLLSLAQVYGHSQADSLSKEQINQLKSEQVRMFEMFTNGDVGTFKKLAGEDFLTINADGTYMDKVETFELIPKFKGSTYKVLEQTDRIYNNLVISTGRAKFYFGPILAADVYFHQAWIFRDNRWQYISWQGTMTGTPKYYPIFMTLIGILILFVLRWVVYKIIKKKK